jgi:hypothetical protein
MKRFFYATKPISNFAALSDLCGSAVEISNFSGGREDSLRGTDRSHKSSGKRPLTFFNPMNDIQTLKTALVLLAVLLCMRRRRTTTAAEREEQNQILMQMETERKDRA